VNLQQLIEQYVAFRQTLGECFRGQAGILRAFGRSLGAQVDISAVRAEQVSVFLAGAGSLTRSWHVRYGALLGFYRYATSRGHATTTPLPTSVPKRPPGFVPYIYSQEELRRLLAATDSCRHPCSSVEPITLRTIVLLLYGTGLRVREALNLNRPDVDPNNALLTVLRTKFFKSRLVPFGPQLSTLLSQYAQRRPSGSSGGTDPIPFFTSPEGVRLSRNTLERRWKHLREQAGIHRSDGASYQPRLHDLRHTFAVNRVLSWYRQGADVQKLLPHLSVYLGHVCLAATQVYLSMTPELLAEANSRFERYAAGEGNHD
jgi:integrase/recombinase XerD